MLAATTGVAPKNAVAIPVVQGSWIPVTIHIFARLWPFFSPNPEAFEFTNLYRLIFYLSFNLSVLSLVYLMVVSFRRYLDKTGRIWDELNRNSYGVYIIHVIMIGIFGMLVISLSLPAVVKWILLFILTYTGSNLVVSGYYAVKRGIAPKRKSVTS